MRLFINKCNWFSLRWKYWYSWRSDSLQTFSSVKLCCHQWSWKLKSKNIWTFSLLLFSVHLAMEAVGYADPALNKIRIKYLSNKANDDIPPCTLQLVQTFHTGQIFDDIAISIIDIHAVRLVKCRHLNRYFCWSEY